MGRHREDLDIVIAAQDKTRGVLNGLRDQIIGIGAAYLGWRAASDFVGDSIKEAANYQATMKSLHSVVGATGRDINKVYSEMEGHLGGLASKASVAEAFLKGMTTELTVEEISNMTRAVKDASIAMGEDFNTQLPLIIKAVKQLNPAILDNIGVTVRLDQVNKKIRDGFYGVNKEITEATQQHAIYTEIMKQTAKFAGQEAEYLETAKGKWQQLGVAITEAKRVLGTYIVESEAGGGILDWTTEKIKALTSALDSNVSFWKQFALHMEGVKYKDGADNLQELIDETLNVLKVSRIQIGDEFYGPMAGYEADLTGAMEEQVERRREIYTVQSSFLLGLSDDWDAYYEHLWEMFENDEEATIEHSRNLLEQLSENIALRQEAIQLGISEEELARFTAYEAEEMAAQEKADRLIDIERYRVATELGLTRDQVRQLESEYKQTYDRVYQYVTNYTKRIGADFRSFMHQVVADSDRGINSMKGIWNALGKSVRSVILDLMVDAIINLISKIFSVIPALIAETAATKVLTNAYISLAAAKSAVTPWSAPGRIAAAATVKGALTGLLGFDDPINDELAFKHGRDYADYFMEGVQTRFSAPRFGRDMVQYVDQSPMLPASSSASSSVVNLNFYGPVTSKQFVYDEVVPAIELAVANKASKIVVSDSGLTGAAEVSV